MKTVQELQAECQPKCQPKRYRVTAPGNTTGHTEMWFREREHANIYMSQLRVMSNLHLMLDGKKIYLSTVWPRTQRG